jgi:hypothetical protein
LPEQKKEKNFIQKIRFRKKLHSVKEEKKDVALLQNHRCQIFLGTRDQKWEKWQMAIEIPNGYKIYHI